MCKKFYDSTIKMLVFYNKMKVCTCFLLFRIFANTNSSPINTLKENNVGTHLALNVNLDVNLEENSKNVFVATNETVIDVNKTHRPNFRAQRVETFTNFIQGVANILNTYEDTAFADFFDILDKEIRKYHYRGCKFYELTENYEFRSLMADKLDLIKRKSIPILKADINEVVAVIRHETYDRNVKELLDYINSLYREDVREKFRKVLSDLKAYGNSTSGRPKKYLVKIIRDGVRAIVFNHYTDLNINVRREMKKSIEIFLKKIKNSPSSSSKTNLYHYKPAVRESENTAKISGYNIAIEDENLEHYSKIDAKSTADNKHIFILRASDENNQEESTKKEESNIQQLHITYLSTAESSDETLEGNFIELPQERKFNSQPNATPYTEDIAYKNTEIPEIMYESATRSKLVQRMLIEQSTDRLPTVQPNTTPKLRFVSDEDLRRSIPPPMPEEELSIDVFERDERKRQKALAKSNRIINVQHGMKIYLKRMRNLQNKVNQLKKIDEYNQYSRTSVISNRYKVKHAIDEYEAKDKNLKDKNKGKVSEKIKKTKLVSERQNYKNEARAQTEKINKKVRKTKGDVKKTNPMKEDVQNLESNKETVKIKLNDRHAHKLKKPKKVTKRKSMRITKSAKTDRKYKGTTDADDVVTSVEIRVRRSVEPLPTAENNAGNNITVNDKYSKLTKTTLNVTEEVKPKKKNTANDDLVTKDNPTQRYRRILEFSSPPLYDQLFDDHTFIA